MPQQPDRPDLAQLGRQARELIDGHPICARVHPPYLTWSATAP